MTVDQESRTNDPDRHTSARSQHRGRAPAGDDFPGRGMAAFIVRMPRYARLAWNLARDPEVPAARRAAVLLAAAYLVSPIDAVPGIIPGIGQLDDLVVIVAGIHVALAGLDPEHRQTHLQLAGMSNDDYDADVATLRAAGAWFVRTTTSALRGAPRVLRETVGPLAAVARERVGDGLQRARTRRDS